MARRLRILTPAPLRSRYARRSNLLQTPLPALDAGAGRTAPEPVRTRRGIFCLRDRTSADGRVTRSWAYDINDSGMVVGEVRLEDPVTGTWQVPFTWTPGSGVTLLDTAGETNSVAWGTNANAVVGRIGSGWIGEEQDPAVWVNGELEIIPDLAGYPYSTGSAVNRARVVAGYSADEPAPNPDQTALPQAWVAIRR